MKEHIDRTGQRTGRLVYQEKVGKNYRSQIIWRAVCDCGNVVERVYSSHAKSCGCTRREWNQSQRNRSTKGQFIRTSNLPQESPIAKRIKLSNFNRLDHCTRHNHTCLCANYMHCLDEKHAREEQLAKGDCYVPTKAERILDATECVA